MSRSTLFPSNFVAVNRRAFCHQRTVRAWLRTQRIAVAGIPESRPSSATVASPRLAEKCR